MKIALIGPGLMEIPPKAWGAIEILIWNYYQRLTELGHMVTIYNTQDLHRVAAEINKGGYDFVHLHYEEYVRFFSRHLAVPFIATSHYGYINKPEKWSRGYYSIFVDSFRAPGIVALSPQIESLYKENGYQGETYVLPNGIDVAAFAFRPKGNGRALYLGKIEPRKRQAFLARALDGKATIDFVGPMADSGFKEGATTRYCGTWTKEQVYQNLTNYSCLVLLSDGEAAPVVVPEALAAGLSVVVSRSAAANLDEQEFISVVPDDETDGAALAAIIDRQVAGNDARRDRIRAYGTSRFDQPVIMGRYVKIIENFRDGRLGPPRVGVKLVHYRFFDYWISRAAVFLRTNPAIRPLVNILRSNKSSQKRLS